MDENSDKGAIALHLLMSLLSDLAVYEPERLDRMADTMARILDQMEHPEDCVEARVAYDALLGLAKR